MGLSFKALLFSFLNFAIIHGGNPCRVSSCGSSKLSIQFPFKFENQIFASNCTYFDLICSVSQSKITVNFPYSGDFYVRKIDYIRRRIQLVDPADCLLKKLMNFSLESSPFKAKKYENFTFYTCPLDFQAFDSHVNRIGCLSNSVNITVAGKELPREFMERHGCRSNGSWRIPVSGPLEFDDGGLEDFLFLTWDEIFCKDCGGSDHQEGKRGPKPIAKIVGIALSLPALLIIGLSCCSVFCFHLMKMIRHKEEAHPAAAPTTLVSPPITIGTPMQPPSTASNTGFDESKIMACTEIVVLSENDEGSPSSNNNTCSICLENYCKKEAIRIISKCGHCFHDSCIQHWLGKNSTCPVCRTRLSDVPM